MPEYLVSWAIQVDADNPLEAARRAREMQLDPNSLATFFTVADDDNGESFAVDVADGEAEI
jgi:hypothetical protein